MNERLEALYGEAMRTLAKQEGHKPVLPQFMGGDDRRDLAEQRRAHSRSLILTVLPGTIHEIAQRTNLSYSATRDNLQHLARMGQVESRYIGSTKSWWRSS